MIQRRTPLKRKTPLQRSRIPIRKVGIKRQAINRQYAKLRRTYLAFHPYCQFFIAEAKLDEAEVIRLGGVMTWRDGDNGSRWYDVPRSVDVHHKRGRGRYLLDVSTWMAVSREGHQFIHDHPKEARAKGYLLDR